VIILLSTGGANGGGYMASKYAVLGFHGLILFSQGIINSLPIKYLAFFGNLGALWNILGDTSLFFIIHFLLERKIGIGVKDHFFYFSS
jgi:hypothetical protein